jgi:putative ABC transport system permease protein
MRLKHWFYTVPLRLRSLFRRAQVEQELDEELRYHIERQIEEHIAKGMTLDEARYAALRAMGGVERRKEECRDMRRVRFVEDLIQDLRYGLRTLRKSPGFTAVAALSLALGIGANTAIFSLVDAVLLKMLPVKSPEQLVAIESLDQRGERNKIFSYPIFERIRDRSQVFTGVLAAEDDTNRVETVGPEPGGRMEQAEVQLVSGEYFQVLGVNAVAGRLLTAADNQKPGAHPVVALSYGFWQRRFAGDVSVIGQNIRLKGQPFTIIGVTQPGFFGESVGRAPDVWAPMMMMPQLRRGQSYLNQSNVRWLRIIARLQPGVREEQAQAALNALLGQIKSEPGDVGKWAGLIYAKIGLIHGGQGLSEMRDRFSKQLRILMAVVGLALLIACANVANLLLARATTRQREVAIRLAIGAGRFRLIRQFLTESVLLAAIGGALGLLFAWWGGHLLLILVSNDSTPIPIDITPNARILGFTIAVSLLTALLFGLAPALVATRQNVDAALKTIVLARPRLSRLLVIMQIALSLLLLTGAGLFVRTLRNLRALDLGFAAESVIQARIDPLVSGYKREQLPDLYRRLLDRLNSAPGVRSASMADSGFRMGGSRSCCIGVEGYVHRPGEDREVRTTNVTPGYFQTMGLPLLLGRDFIPQEALGKPGEFPKVAIINETMARYYFGETSPLGRRFGWGDPSKPINTDIEIIGVARDAVYGKLRQKARPLIYFPGQGGDVLVARAAADPAMLLTMIRQEIQVIDKSLEISSVRTIPQLRDQELVQERLLAQLSSFFGLLALLLACVGLYGVMSYDVARRTHEIGIRMALGAQRRDVVGLVLRETMLLVGAGVVIGLSGALWATRLIATLLYGLTPNDPLTMALAGLLLLTVATLSAYIPARRASRVDPMVALRLD